MEQKEATAELSYDELMDIIVNNKPVPNVVDVPDIILDHSLVTEAHLNPRVKPWEQKKEIPVIGGLVREKAETKGLAQEVELVKKSNSLEKLTNYYALEAEFQKQLKSSDGLSAFRSKENSSSTLSNLNQQQPKNI